MEKKEVYNFSAGPCILPKEVFEQCAAEMMDY
jgi:phosphoserine aminotransferase